MKVTTLTLEFPNTKVSRGDYLKPRRETYVLGPAAASDLAANPYVLSFCCYRTMLLGAPNALGKAYLNPGKIHLISEPLHPHHLVGEDAVERCEFSKRHYLLFRLQTGNGRWANRKLFGFRRSDMSRHASWLRFQPGEAIMAPGSNWPPSFSDAADFEKRIGSIGCENGSMSRTQAWSTWFWLLTRLTFYLGKRATSGEGLELLPWDSGELAVCWRGFDLVKKGF